jgi:LCP family protein required for cell wall assembly
VNLLLVAACLGAAFGLGKLRSTLEAVPVVDVGSSLAETVDLQEPRNVLIIGTDSAVGLDESDPAAVGRPASENLADVIMILRVDPRDGTARLLSIPRDTRVELPDGSVQKINSAMLLPNGPRSVVQTIKQNFGISIDHFVQVDFAAFKRLVEVLGGVPVYFTTPVRDRNTGLFIDEAGCYQLGPDQALAYARSRHFEFKGFDGRWRVDESGDLGRITRQQDFIKRAMRKASDMGIRNPSTAVGLIDAATGAVVLDDTLNVDTILGLLDQFRVFNPDDLNSQQVPTVSSPRSGIAYQEVLWDEAEPLLEAFRGVDPSVGLVPRNVIVDVRAPSSAAGAADAVAALDAAGFDAELLTTRSAGSQTTITHGPGGREAAVLLARHLQTIPRLVEDDDVRGRRVVLSVGRDFNGVRSEPLPVEELPPALLPPPADPDTTEAAPGPGSTAAPAEGATDGAVAGSAPPEDERDDLPPPGVVPTDPVKAAACR